MAALIGAALAIGVAVFAHAVGFDRDRAFYPAVLIVIASYYLLFALMAGISGRGLVEEIAALLVFAAVAVLGFRTSLWLVAAGLALHGLFDFVRPLALSEHGAPAWWPPFCLAFDVAAAAGLALLLWPRPARTVRPAP
jgi:hypothetical protein